MIGRMTLTEFIILMGVIFYVLFDVWVVCVYGGEQSISYTLDKLAHKYPMIALATGGVVCHIFWRIME